MSVTIKNIAEVSGVSRGTVDRVLNNRGKVNPETEERVRKIAAQLGYKPNLAGKALAARKKSPVIGVVLPSEGNPFYDEVIEGIRQAEKELSDYGVTVNLKSMRGYDPVQQLKLIDSFGDSISMLVLVPISDERIAAKIDELMDAGIPTVTMNTDIQGSVRVCYVGSDYTKGGEIACGIMALLRKGQAKFGIATGSTKMLGHSQRIAGFRSVIKARYPGMTLLDSIETNDDDIIAYEETSRMLRNHPEMDSIFIVAGGVYGVCRAVISAGREKSMTIVSFDTIPTTVEMLRQGVIQATICQQPVAQGYESIKKAFDYFISGTQRDDKFIVDHGIRILECF